MGDLLDLQTSIGRGGIYEEGKDQAGTIQERIILAKYIANQVLEVALQAKEDTEKVKVVALTETSAIKDEVQSTIDLVKKIDQDQRR